MQPLNAAAPPSPAYEKESHMDAESSQARAAADGVVRDYEAKRDSLSSAIDKSKYLVADLKNFNGQEWTVRYPHLKADSAPNVRPGMARRTLTFADEPAAPRPVIMNETPVRHAMKRSLTLAPGLAPATEDVAADSTPDAPDAFSILRLDLNMGAQRHAKALITHLEKASIAALLDTRLAASLDHLALLQARIHDAHSRVLVTGDLNAGKSTLVNALLRHEVMPTDQQPLTTRFVEVVSAKENDNVEEIHVETAKYARDDRATYTVEPVSHLEAMATDEEASSPIRVYLREADAADSILHNGVVDISLIDAPGLNRDSIKTTANFARQEEIDVVVFVVSAANHFTLSAKEFIWQASHEKAHLFIVVNRYDQIKDKNKCRRVVLEQIKQLSPSTYEDADDLVHFVDSASAVVGDLDENFAHLERSLRSFVLVNRSKSKLGPAQNYVSHLLADVELLASANTIVATQERDAARDEIKRVRPVLDAMKQGQEGLEGGLVAEEEHVTAEASTRTQAALTRALERVSRGELAVDDGSMPAWPGLLGAWDYACDVRRALVASVEFVAGLAEGDARRLTTEGVERVSALGKDLPVEPSQRVFNPNAMFARRRGVATVGLQATATDIFDFHYMLGAASTSSALSSVSTVSSASAGAASLAVGAIVGTKALGVRAAVEGVVRVSELAANPTVRKWFAPVLGVVAVGTVAYIVYELPRSIPRNVGRHVQATLVEEEYAAAQAARVGREVRKVMRLAAWDLRERFRGAVDARAEVVRAAEETERKATRAMTWFGQVEQQVDLIRDEIGKW